MAALSPISNSNPDLRAVLSENLIDPVSLEPLRTAVVIVSCGHTFNETTIVDCLARDKLCPIDRKPIEKYIPNYTVRHIVECVFSDSKGEEKEDPFQKKDLKEDEKIPLGQKVPPAHKSKDAYIELLLNLLEKPAIKKNPELSTLFAEQVEALINQENEDLSSQQKESCKWTEKLLVDNEVRTFVLAKLQSIHARTSAQKDSIPGSHLSPLLFPNISSQNKVTSIESASAPISGSTLTLKAEPKSKIQPAKIQEMKCVSILEGHSKTPGQPRWAPATKHGVQVYGGQYIYDGVGGMIYHLLPLSAEDRLISTGWDGLIKLWNPSVGQCLKTIAPPKMMIWNAYIKDVKLLPDGKLAVLTCDTSWVLKILDPSNMQCVKELSVELAHCLISLGGNIVACGGKTIKILDISTGVCHRTLNPSMENVDITKLTLLKDEILAASFGKSLTIDLWDISTGKLLQTLQKPESSYCSALIKLTNSTLICGGAGYIHLYDLGTGQWLRTLQGHKGWIDDFAVLGDSTLVSTSQDHSIKFWDPFTGECLRTLEYSEKNAKALTVLKDGTLVIGLSDGTMELWR